MEGEAKTLYGAVTVYRERGAYLRRLEQFHKAKAAYDEAFKYGPEDFRLLNGRSQVCTDAVLPQQAYDDASLALAVNPRDITARNTQANALFSMTDFEQSAVINSRFFRIRQKPAYFRVGFDQCISTLHDCVGDRAGPVMMDFLPTIQKMESLKAAQETKSHHICRIPPPPEMKNNVTQLEKHKQTVLSRVLAMKYLGEMAGDKFFLQDLVNDVRLFSANKSHSEKLQALAEEALQILTDRQNMLRTQRPYYSIKYAERTESKRQTQFMKELFERGRRSNYATAERMVRYIEKCMREYRTSEMITKAERMQLFLDKHTPYTFPEKELFIDRLYRAVGEGYLNQYRLSYKLSESGNRRRIAFLMGLPVGRPKSFDSVISEYPQKLGNLEVEKENMMALLELCENACMRCWLMYEIAQILTTQKNYPLAKFYAKKCQHEALKNTFNSWWLNACFMNMKGDMQQRNVTEIRALVEEAVNFLRGKSDSEQVHAFLLKCYEIVREPVESDDMKVERHRQEQILKVLDDESRVKALLLFKRMSLVPLKRRFRLLPSKRTTNQKALEESARTKYCQRGLTILPGKEKALPRLPKTEILGFMPFKDII